MSKVNERALYPPVKQWFKAERGCDVAVADTPKDKLKVRLPRNLKKREIDVVALEPTARERSVVHLAEGKLFADGQSLETCLNQAESVRAVGDFAWVFFPKRDWDKVPEKERRHNEQLVTARGMGLLLVKGKSCEARILAPSNPHKDENSVAEVFEALGESRDAVFPPVSVLGAAEAQRAAGTMALVAMVKDIVSQILNCRWEDSGHDGGHVRRGFYIVWSDVEEDVYPEIDPWGGYLRDGIPALWLWQNITVPQLLDRLNSAARCLGRTAGSATTGSGKWSRSGRFPIEWCIC
jgi:hypothetical protein